MKPNDDTLDIDAIQSALGANVFNSLVNISMADKFVWIKNPKVGSSSLDITLQSVAGRSLKGLSTKPHSSIQDSVFVKPYQLPTRQIHNILTSDRYFKFTFARNPYKRLYSAYNDKIAGNKSNKVQILRYLGLDTSDIEQEVSFSEFVHALSEIDPLNMDRHWMPQWMLTSANVIEYDFIGKLESFDDDLRYVFSILKLDIDEYYKYYAPHRNKVGTSIEDHLDDQEVLDKINNIYGEDFKIFDYPITHQVSALRLAG